MKQGTFTHLDYDYFIKKKFIISKHFDVNQIQPSSIDLKLGSECYKISSSFLSHNKKVKDKILEFSKKKFDLRKGLIFKKNVTYLVKINEYLSLPNKIFGKCNPKSSTGRLDIFCRTVLDNCDEYEKIPFGYKGPIFLEITSRAFDIYLKYGDSLNQMRLVNSSNKFLNDINLKNYHKKNPIFFNNYNKPIIPSISNGLKISVNLSNKKLISAYKAKKNSPVLNFRKIRQHKISDFWESIKTSNKQIKILPNNFYILRSKQKIKIPKNMAAEMIPYDTGIGDFRAHYAGFFDPGFGSINGSYAVLELRTNEVKFNLEDGQIIARLVYEYLNKSPKFTYGSKINSNYQNQGLALSKHFNIINKNE